MANFDWNSVLLDLICRVYKAWNGDCSDLGKFSPNWVSTLAATYTAQGAPTFLTPEAETDFLADLDALESHLGELENDLAPADDFTLRGVIASLRGDLAPI